MFSIHDAEIIKYCVDFENKKIILKVKNNNQKWEIIFDDFIAFEFCDFGF